MSSKLSQYAPSGAAVGKAFGTIGSAISSGVEKRNYNDKVQNLLAMYNAGEGPFEGLQPSAKAGKMATLLLPYDSGMSSKYSSLADSLTSKEQEQQKQDATTMEERAFNKDVFSTIGRNFEGEDSAKSEELGYLEAAKKFGERDPSRAFDLLAKSEAAREKGLIASEKKEAIELALQNLSTASEIWRDDPDNKLKQDQVRDAWNRASSLGAKAQNPIDDYLREQYNKSQFGLSERKFQADEDRKKIEDQQWEMNYKLQAQNIENDNRLAWKSFELAKRKAELENQEGNASEGERKSSGYAARMKNALGIMKETLPKLSKIELTAVMAGSPINSSSGQRYNAALDDYVKAQLRQESGAVIGESEMKGGYSQYGISPFDSRELIADKMKRLEVGYQAMLSNSGNLSKKVEQISEGRNKTQATEQKEKPAVVNLQKVTKGKAF
jgi:hypothetical protein